MFRMTASVFEFLTLMLGVGEVCPNPLQLVKKNSALETTGLLIQVLVAYLLLKLWNPAGPLLITLPPWQTLQIVLENLPLLDPAMVPTPVLMKLARAMLKSSTLMPNLRT